MDHANFFEILVRISENNSKWISISRILHENTRANPTEKYSSLLKLKNHVNVNKDMAILFQLEFLRVGGNKELD